MDLDIELIKELIANREKIDAQLASLCIGETPRSTARKPQKCGTCGAEGHTSRTCPQRSADPQP